MQVVDDDDTACSHCGGREFADNGADEMLYCDAKTDNGVCNAGYHAKRVCVHACEVGELCMRVVCV